jgi:hypothetical protein
MLLNVLGEETPKLLPEQVKDINLASEMKNFHPRKERKRRYLAQPTMKLKKTKKRSCNVQGFHYNNPTF